MVLVTGASHSISRHIIQKFLAEGFSVKAWIRNEDEKKLLYDKAVSFYEGDILDVTDVYESMSGVKLVIHCDTVDMSIPMSYVDRMKYNVEGTANIVNAMLYHQVPKIIFLSSIQTLGVDPEKVIDEDVKSEKNEWTTDAALSLMLAEREVWRGSVEGLDIAIIHAASIFDSKGEGSIFYNRVCQEVRSGRVALFPSDVQYVGSQDLAEMTFRVSQHDGWNKKWIAIAESISSENFYASIGEHLNLPFRFVKMNEPKVFLKISKDFFLSWIGKHRMYRRTNGRRDMTRFQYDASLTDQTFHMQWKKLSELF